VCILSFFKNHIAELFISDHLHSQDDTQDSNSDTEPTASSSLATPNMDEVLETWPVNDPSAVAEVMLAKTPRSSIL